MATASIRKRLAAVILLAEDEDEEEVEIPKKKRRKHQCWVKPWLKRREDPDTDTIFTLQKELLMENNQLEYRRLLRMDEPTYRLLLGKIHAAVEKENTTFRDAIPADQRLSATLHYLATGESQVSVGRQFRISQPSIGRIIRETCQAIVNILGPEVLQTPRTREEWQAVADKFLQKWNFPHCVGGLDGKHITIYPPPNSGSLYYNYKGGFSLVLMALVDANLDFIYIDVGHYGREADGGIWRYCSLKQGITSGKIPLPHPAPLPGTNIVAPYVIVSDDAFPLGEHLQKPYCRRKLQHRERIYNYRLSRARRVSENAFGVMANRFRVLLTDMNLLPDAGEKVVQATCVLHNFLRRRCGKNYLTTAPTEAEADRRIAPDMRTRVAMQPIYPARGRKHEIIGKNIRETLADHFVSPAGRVSWQDRMVSA